MMNLAVELSQVAMLLAGLCLRRNTMCELINNCHKFAFHWFVNTGNRYGINCSRSTISSFLYV